ncbi:AIPR family protein [Brevibacillus choshinensis]|uniref:AIPR family protein n=1 Tax=Brevibacillus choshinensis TaxID=54911 RepID=A0ABX7FL09_BRECH|nr:AIPR family protein [Brevibacillus choshinensis]QRG66007.1 AIPR family protein [Brevibacillus choshinensis]
MHDGKGEPSNGDLKKFFDGIRDLFNSRYDIFNHKVKKKQAEIENALYDVQTKYKVIVSYTGLNFSRHNQKEVDDFLAEMNDANDVVTVSLFNQTRLHDSLKIIGSAEPINLNIVLKEWGKKTVPHKAFYGQVNALEIAEWWKNNENNLFSKNLRELLPDADINEEIRQTLEQEPEKFWYYNNGITMVCKDVNKTMLGGPDNDFGQFHCEDVSIVNGAQTLGTIGKYGQKNNAEEYLKNIYVQVRIISLDNAMGDFGKKITRSNNRQNNIENRDFVALDPLQQTLQTELAIDGISYHIMRSINEQKNDTDTSFNIVESTIALACSHKDVSLAVQVKREIGKLWEDIEKAPYKSLFNPQLSGLYMWRCVRIQRKIDSAIQTLSSQKTNREHSIVIHGMRLLSHLVFQEIDLKQLGNPLFDFDTFLNTFDFNKSILDNYGWLVDELDKNYGNTAVIPTLFKNSTKCTNLVRKIKSSKKKQST